MASALLRSWLGCQLSLHELRKNEAKLATGETQETSRVAAPIRAQIAALQEVVVIGGFGASNALLKPSCGVGQEGNVVGKDTQDEFVLLCAVAMGSQG